MPEPVTPPTGGTTVEELRGRLQRNRQTFLDKFSARIAVVEGWRPVFAGFGVLGALIAAIARAFPGDWGLGLTIFGAVLAAAGGALVVLMDFKKLEITQDAKAAWEVADAAVDVLESNEAQLTASQAAARAAAAEATAFDARRLARIEAIRLMIESIEAAFLSNADAETSARRLLLAAVANLQRAVDYVAGDVLTFTIFQRQDTRGDVRMQPIAREWSDRARGVEPGRPWVKGEGYTGVLWNLAETNHRASVVEPDTDAPGVRAKYPVRNPADDQERRYRSVASFPILIGKDNAVWGVVTATSDRGGVFDHTGNLARQSVETVRDVALAASLLAKLGDGRR